jgi:hypothetical protein
MSSLYHGTSSNQDFLSASISGCTNGPFSIVTTASPHGFSSQDQVVIFGANGFSGTGPNETEPLAAWSITVTGPTTFTLNNGSAFSGSYSGGGTVLSISPGPQIQLPSDGDTFNAAALNTGMMAVVDRTQLLAQYVAQLWQGLFLGQSELSANPWGVNAGGAGATLPTGVGTSGVLGTAGTGTGFTAGVGVGGFGFGVGPGGFFEGGATGPGLTCQGGSTSGNGATCTGTGTGIGCQGTGGGGAGGGTGTNGQVGSGGYFLGGSADAAGVVGVGGASGPGVSGIGGTGSAPGGTFTGTGSSAGVVGVAGPTGAGGSFVASAGVGCFCTASGGNFAGAVCQGSGNGNGLNAVGGANGAGVNATAGSANNDSIVGNVGPIFPNCSAPSNPAPNRLYKDNHVAAAAMLTTNGATPTINFGFNIANVTATLSQIAVTFTTPMANADYCVVPSAVVDGASNVYPCTAKSLSTGGFTLIMATAGLPGGSASFAGTSGMQVWFEVIGVQ